MRPGGAGGGGDGGGGDDNDDVDGDVDGDGAGGAGWKSVASVHARRRMSSCKTITSPAVQHRDSFKYVPGVIAACDGSIAAPLSVAVTASLPHQAGIRSQRSNCSVELHSVTLSVTVPSPHG